MKKFKEFIGIICIILMLAILFGGLAFINYKVWRAEHPQAKTWTYFLGN